jgi:hypothetical protein
VGLPTPSESPMRGYSYSPLGWIFLFPVLGKIARLYMVFWAENRARTQRGSRDFLLIMIGPQINHGK